MADSARWVDLGREQTAFMFYENWWIWRTDMVDPAGWLGHAMFHPAAQMGAELASFAVDETRGRGVGFLPPRCQVYTSWDQDRSRWQVVLDDVLGQLRRQAGDLDFGFVRLSDSLFPASFHFAGWGMYTSCPHLWGEYVPEAHGIQVLTDRQMDKAHDLTGWQVERLDSRHWLVTARDLRAWFGCAREDFE